MLERSRALSSLLQDRWHLGSTSSVLHQASAILLSGAYLLLACWVMAIARGPAAYAQFLSLFAHPLVRVPFALGLSALVFHACNRVRQRLRDGEFGGEHRRWRIWLQRSRWARRVTGPALMLLGAWFVVSVLLSATLNHVQVRVWMSRPWNAASLLALILLGAEKSNRDLSDIIESSVPDPGMRLAMLLLTRGVHLLAAVSAVIAVYVAAFGNFR